MGRGFGLLAASTLCWSPDPPTPPPGSPPAPPVPPPPAPPTPPAGGSPFAVFPDQASFQARLDREARSLLKEKYGLNEKELDERLKRAKELEEAEAARIKAQQTKEQQLEAEKAEAEARAKAADERANAATRQAEVTGMCARFGFKNLDYALFEAGKSGKSGAELEAHFTEMAKDDSKKAALGLAVPAPEVVPVGGNTAPGTPPGGNPPPPPPPGGGAPEVVDVMKMSPAAFAAHLASKHGA
jgi:hypothetical protein